MKTTYPKTRITKKWHILLGLLILSVTTHLTHPPMYEIEQEHVHMHRTGEQITTITIQHITYTDIIVQPTWKSVTKDHIGYYYDREQHQLILYEPKLILPLRDTETYAPL